jgi:uncharacterized protein DUF2786
MILAEGIALLLVLTLLGTPRAIFVALRERASWAREMDWSWLSPVRRARRSATEDAYEQWKREGGGAWLDSWWDAPEGARPQAGEAAAAPPESPGRMSVEEARRKLEALLALTVARGATPAEAATARAIAERLKAEYDLH